MECARVKVSPKTRSVDTGYYDRNIGTLTLSLLHFLPNFSLKVHYQHLILQMYEIVLFLSFQLQSIYRN